MLVEVEIDADRFEMLYRAKQIDQRRPSRSMAHVMTTTNLRRLASLSRASRRGR
jgi:hypothetical protein